jgi:hypothetical protein
MGSKMTPEIAAQKLESSLRKFSWLVSVGVGRVENGESVIFVYVKSSRHPQLRNIESGWLGYKVIVRQSGAMRPLLAAYS